MTAPKTEQPTVPVIVTAEPDSKLEHLLARYDDLAGKKAAAEEEFKTLTDAIKNELFAAAAAAAEPGVDVKKIFVRSPYLRAPLALTSSNPVRLSKRFKDEQPFLWASYCETGKTQWTLARQR